MTLSAFALFLAATAAEPSLDAKPADTPEFVAADAGNITHGRSPTDLELASALGISENKLRLALSSSRELVSLEAEGKPATAVRQSRISNTISVLAAASSGGFGNSPRASMAAPAPPPPVVHQTSDAREESALSDLIAMGFARGVALTALRQANGDVNAAANSLF